MSPTAQEILDYLGIDPPSPVSRRRFLELFGGGIVIGVAGCDLAAQETAAPSRFGRRLPDDYNAFLRIGEDGRVTCFTGKIEMGQGIHTSLAQMLADELEVALDVVDMVMGDTDLCPWDMGTFGSMTTRFFGPPLRAAAAEAREVLLELAAEKLEVPRDQLTVADGVVSVAGQPQRSATYAELASGQRIARRLDGEAALEAVKDFTIVGRSETRHDAVAKVTGQAEYAGDIRREGMVYARLLRPPAHGATRVEVDASGLDAVPGAALVRDGDLIAVVHAAPDGAERGLQQLKASWETPESDLDEDSIFEHLLKVAPAGDVLERGGNLEPGRAASTARVAHTYLDGYVAHAAMETHTAVAEFADGRCTIWASTQTPFPLKSQAAEALGLAEDAVRVIPPFVGGGFGGKTYNQQAIEAARLAKKVGRPVQVAWSRAEEFFFDTFRPAAVVTIDAGLGEGGRITDWDYTTYFAGSRGSEHFYEIPNHRTVASPSSWRGGPGTHPFATGAWRAPGNNTNTFARESHIDALAAAAGVDPVEFRRRHLSDPKMRRVLDATAERFGWHPAPPPSGRGQGIALGIDAGTFVGLAVEVAVDPSTGDVRVIRMVCAQDMGLTINPEGAAIQMEGCLTMGLGYALAEEVRFEGGKVLDTNFDTYEIPRFSWLPEIDTVILDAVNDPPQGGGEPAIIVVGAAVANAIHDAVGARVLRMPMTPERVTAAMAKG
jgi:isoquinoline 1-oxidoreductase